MNFHLIKLKSFNGFESLCASGVFCVVVSFHEAHNFILHDAALQ